MHLRICAWLQNGHRLNAWIVHGNHFVLKWYETHCKPLGMKSAYELTRDELTSSYLNPIVYYYHSLWLTGSGEAKNEKQTCVVHMQSFKE